MCACGSKRRPQLLVADAATRDGSSETLRDVAIPLPEFVGKGAADGTCDGKYETVLSGGQYRVANILFRVLNEMRTRLFQPRSIRSAPGPQHARVRRACAQDVYNHILIDAKRSTE